MLYMIETLNAWQPRGLTCCCCCMLRMCWLRGIWGLRISQPACGRASVIVIASRIRGCVPRPSAPVLARRYLLAGADWK
jgi:hypothetical protein